MKGQQAIFCNKCQSNKIKTIDNKTIGLAAMAMSVLASIFIITIPFTIVSFLGGILFLFIPIRKATCQECKNTQNITKEQLREFKNWGKI